MNLHYLGGGNDMTFLVPLQEDFAIRRADLTLGLRSATLHYQELAVPGIGGAWCVRQLSWAVAGIALAREPCYEMHRSVVIANAIEALANKVEWAQTPESKRQALRVLGKRAFGREPGEWRFERLKSRECYVLATYRQAVTRALPPETGLGFASGPGRFNSMRLSHAGSDLANAFLYGAEQRGMGKGTPHLRNNLLRWIDGDFTPASYLEELRQRLSYRYSTREEKEVLRERLLSTVSHLHPIVGKDPMRRHRLAQCIMKVVRKPDTWDNVSALQEDLRRNGGAQHAEEIETILRFEEMRGAAVDLLAMLATIVEQAGTNVSITEAAQDHKVKKLCERLKQQAQAYLGRPSESLHKAAEKFGRECLKDDEKVVEFIVGRDDRIIQAANGAIWRGPVFRADFAGIQGVSDERDGPATGRPGRIFQFIDLWTDCNV